MAGYSAAYEPKRFFIQQFCFSLFTAVLWLKNLCRHKGRTKPQIDKNLHCYNLKSIFKPSLLSIHTFKNATQLLKTSFFVSQSLTNAISLTYSISSKRVFIVVIHFSARKKKLKPYTSGSIFPITPRQRSNSPSRGKA